MKDFRGVYVIENKITGKKYIGISVKMIRRWKDHQYRLNNNIHHSPKLQNAWNKYGAENFKFYAIHFACSNTDLGKLERSYIEKYDTYKNGYNCTPGGECIDKMVAKNMSDLGKGANNSRAKLEEKEVIKILIRSLQDETNGSINKSYPDMARSTISDICNNRKWTYLPRDIDKLKEILNQYKDNEYLPDHEITTKVIQKGIGIGEGANNSRAKLTEKEVIDILIRKLSGETVSKISKDYIYVSKGTIANICQGRRWTYLPRDIDKLKNMATS